jgi:acetamidase/formamidase
MAIYHLQPVPRALHGFFSRDLPPALTSDPGDVVVFQTLDAGWGAVRQEPGFTEPINFTPRDLSRDVAHPLAGPVAVRGAKAGMTLEIRINRIRTGRWGWSAGPGAAAQLDPYLELGAGPGGPPAVITVPRAAGADVPHG